MRVLSVNRSHWRDAIPCGSDAVEQRHRGRQNADAHEGVADGLVPLTVGVVVEEEAGEDENDGDPCAQPHQLVQRGQVGDEDAAEERENEEDGGLGVEEFGRLIVAGILRLLGLLYRKQTQLDGDGGDDSGVLGCSGTMIAPLALEKSVHTASRAG